MSEKKRKSNESESQRAVRNRQNESSEQISPPSSPLLDPLDHQNESSEQISPRSSLQLEQDEKDRIGVDFDVNSETEFFCRANMIDLLREDGSFKTPSGEWVLHARGDAYLPRDAIVPPEEAKKEIVNRPERERLWSLQEEPCHVLIVSNYLRFHLCTFLWPVRLWNSKWETEIFYRPDRKADLRLLLDTMHRYVIYGTDDCAVKIAGKCKKEEGRVFLLCCDEP